jgi:hypothetical protein
MKKIKIFFSIIGAIASVVSAMIAVINYLPESLKKDTIIERAQISTAKIIAPQAYDVVPKNLDIIKINSTFTRSPGGSALLTESKRVPFAVYKVGHKGIVGVYINGERDSMRVGQSLQVPETDCTIWLFDIKDSIGPYSFELRCEK